ncbi:MAG: L-threonylcarbamoyladenylate synthase [Pseudomonadota bacterium]|nr:L-threonylcarbamoyladenylate synthase [Pseudomonadota bacterium]
MQPVLPATAPSIERAAQLLEQGGLVAFPTETVYGLGADATNGEAVAAIYAAKGRPQFNPLIIHISSTADLDSHIVWNDTARLLASQFWPGPLTLVLPRRKDSSVSLLASAGLDTLAVRLPAHPVAEALLRAFGKPIAAPSANLSGKLSPTTALHVAEALGEKAGLILAGGRSKVGLESTVLDLTLTRPAILRHGGVTREQLEKILGSVDELTSGEGDQARSSPGQLASHYAPDLPLRLNVEFIMDSEALLAFGPDFGIKGGAKRLNLSPDGDLNEAAANLFSMLRKLDDPSFSGIAVMRVPEAGLGAAINDRLRRAALR